jgi:hypothetical protein
VNGAGKSDFATAVSARIADLPMLVPSYDRGGVPPSSRQSPLVQVRHCCASAFDRADVVVRRALSRAAGCRTISRCGVWLTCEGSTRSRSIRRGWR